MQHAAALIEYIITGLISLIWVCLVVNTQFEITAIDLNKNKELLIIAIFPIAYIFGIYVDVFSSLLLKFIELPFKCLFSSEKLIVSFRKLFQGDAGNTSYDRSTQILSKASAGIIKTMETYVSRDRIARGMVLNSLIIGIMIFFTVDSEKKLQLLIITFSVTFISYLARLRLRNLSDTFKTKALAELKRSDTTYPLFRKKRE